MVVMLIPPENVVILLLPLGLFFGYTWTQNAQVPMISMSSLDSLSIL